MYKEEATVALNRMQQQLQRQQPFVSSIRLTLIVSIIRLIQWARTAYTVQTRSTDLQNIYIISCHRIHKRCAHIPVKILADWGLINLTNAIFWLARVQ
jgi:hypothetical protein